MNQNEAQEVSVGKRGWFPIGENIANGFIALNLIAVVFCLVIALNDNSWMFALYSVLACVASILFCILALAVFSIHEELCGLRISQIKANEINDESLKYLRYMAKQLSDKSGK